MNHPGYRLFRSYRSGKLAVTARVDVPSAGGLLPKLPICYHAAASQGGRPQKSLQPLLPSDQQAGGLLSSRTCNSICLTEGSVECHSKLRHSKNPV